MRINIDFITIITIKSIDFKGNDSYKNRFYKGNDSYKIYGINKESNGLAKGCNKLRLQLQTTQEHDAYTVIYNVA